MKAGEHQDTAGHVGPPIGRADSETEVNLGGAEPAGADVPDGKAGKPVAVLRGALAVGVPSSDAVLAEHTPLMPGGGSCRACGFVYTDHPACPAVILAEAGFADFADRVRVVPQADREYGALCELTVAVQRMAVRLDVIGAQVTADMPPTKRQRRWPRIVHRRRFATQYGHPRPQRGRQRCRLVRDPRLGLAMRAHRPRRTQPRRR